MKHHFDSEVAKKYDITTAILLECFYFWIEKNRANNKHFHDGKYWTYNSFKALSELFPYLNERQIKYAIKKMIGENLLLQGNYNENPYDRTSWYALTDLGYSIVQNRPMYNGQNCTMNSSTDNYTDNIEINKEKTNTDVLVKERNKIPPTLEDVRAYCNERENGIDPESFINHYQAVGWKIGKNAMKDWQAAVRTWEKRLYAGGQCRDFYTTPNNYKKNETTDDMGYNGMKFFDGITANLQAREEGRGNDG